jgi:hypothetical protein
LLGKPGRFCSTPEKTCTTDFPALHLALQPVEAFLQSARAIAASAYSFCWIADFCHDEDIVHAPGDRDPIRFDLAYIFRMLLVFFLFKAD